VTESIFWELLAKARRRGATSACECCLKRYLNKLGDQEVSDFGLMLHERVCELNTWRLWGAGQVITGNMSGDSFHYFRTWIVGVGKRAYNTAKSDPDALGPFLDMDEDPVNVDNEPLEYVAIEILKERGLNSDPRDRSSCDADAEPRGIAFELGTLRSGYPKLAGQFPG
jgi:Protein of unknown function (DUF4240)